MLGNHAPTEEAPGRLDAMHTEELRDGLLATEPLAAPELGEWETSLRKPASLYGGGMVPRGVTLDARYAGCAFDLQ